MERKRYPELMRISLFYIFHAVGLIGFLWSSTAQLFVLFIPYHLIWMALILFWEPNWFSKHTLIAAATAFFIGFSAEVIGVQTGYLFGSYAYTPLLGLSLFGVPLIIGMLWMAMSVATHSCVHQASFKKYIPFVWFRVAFGAFVMSAIDYLIEPFAIAQGMWQWQMMSVPWSNYTTWFAVSFLILALYNYWHVKPLAYRTSFNYLFSMTLFFVLYLLFYRGLIL